MYVFSLTAHMYTLAVDLSTLHCDTRLGLFWATVRSARTRLYNDSQSPCRRHNSCVLPVHREQHSEHMVARNIPEYLELQKWKKCSGCCMGFVYVLFSRFDYVRHAC